MSGKQKKNIKCYAIAGYWTKLGQAFMKVHLCWYILIFLYFWSKHYSEFSDDIPIFHASSEWLNQVILWTVESEFIWKFKTRNVTNLHVYMECLTKIKSWGGAAIYPYGNLVLTVRQQKLVPCIFCHPSIHSSNNHRNQDQLSVFRKGYNEKISHKFLIQGNSS